MGVQVWFSRGYLFAPAMQARSHVRLEVNNSHNKRRRMDFKAATRGGREAPGPDVQLMMFV